MPDDNGANADPNNSGPELVLDEVLDVAPADLTDSQREFLTGKADDLSDEDLEAYGIERKPDIPDPAEAKKKEGDDDIKPTGKDDDDIDPADEKMVSRIVNKRDKSLEKRLAALEGSVGGGEIIREIDTYVQENPEYAPYRSSMLKFISANPGRYGKLSASELAGIVARNDLQKLGARKERLAQKKVKETKGAGTSARKSTKRGEKDWAGMSIEEFHKEEGEYMSQGR